MDGVVFAVEKMLVSKLLKAGTNRRVFNVGRHIGVASAGLVADARQVVNTARDEAAGYKEGYGEVAPVRHVVDRVSAFMQMYTLYGMVRPFGCSLLVGSWNADDGAKLYMIEPSGDSFGYFGAAAGKGKQVAKTEVEKLDLENLTAREAIVKLAKIIHSVHDDVKDKPFELELAWVTEETGGVYQLVPEDLKDEAERQAKAELDSDDSDSDSDDN